MRTDRLRTRLRAAAHDATAASRRRNDEHLAEQRLYGWYPYLRLTVFLLGSLLRFDLRNTPGGPGPASCCGGGN